VQRRRSAKSEHPGGSSTGEATSAGAPPKGPLRGLQPALAALLLSLIGPAGQALQERLLPGWRAELVFVGAAVAVALVCLGEIAGLLASAASVAAVLVLSQSTPVALVMVIAQAFVASRLYRRLRSVVLSALFFWSLVGSGAAVLSWAGLLDAAAEDVVIPMMLGGLLGAVAADLLLQRPELWRLLGSTPLPPGDTSRYVASRALLIVGIPLVALSFDPAGSPGALAKAIVLTVLAAAVLNSVITIAAGTVTRALDRIDRAASDVGAGRLPPPTGDEAPPVAEVLRLESSVRGLYEGLANFDALTGLPNRKLLLDRLALAIAQASVSDGPALLVIDLDRFRIIDGSLGHERANVLLKKVGERLGSFVRPGDTVARLGGDEFALLMPGLGGLDLATERAVRIMDAIKQPFYVGDQEVSVTASVGISVHPRDGNDAETLLRNATAATYVAKEQGLDSFRRYTSRISAKDLERGLIEAGLRRAIEQQEMQLHYLPIVDAQTSRILRVEALMRWLRPGFGLVPAASFIGVAEASGLIITMSPWLLKTACRDAQRWSENGHRVDLAINVLPRHLLQPDFLDQLRWVLAATGFDPARLDVEIAESAAIQDFDRCVEALRGLRALGATISVDDFGTGYASLSYLQRLPVDCVKLDQSFVRDIPTNGDGAAIASGVIAMAHTLGLKVVAEGVETVEQLRFLRRRGCDAIQGFLFSPVVPFDELDALLREGRELPPTDVA
jgi:diguanylate cyclase (GGDEF)-like protein